MSVIATFSAGKDPKTQAIVLMYGRRPLIEAYMHFANAGKQPAEFEFKDKLTECVRMAGVKIRPASSVAEVQGISSHSVNMRVLKGISNLVENIGV